MLLAYWLFPITMGLLVSYLIFWQKC